MKPSDYFTFWRHPSIRTTLIATLFDNFSDGLDRFRVEEVVGGAAAAEVRAHAHHVVTGLQGHPETRKFYLLVRKKEIIFW